MVCVDISDLRENPALWTEYIESMGPRVVFSIISNKQIEGKMHCFQSFKVFGGLIGVLDEPVLKIKPRTEWQRKGQALGCAD